MNKFKEFVDCLVTLMFLVTIASLFVVLITLFIKEIQSEKDNNEVEISYETEHESKNTVEMNGETYVLVEGEKEPEETIEMNGKTYMLKEIIKVDGKTYILTEE